ncbi:hypothetical protein [Hymenobacter convexus]|uniref:hypothetical protein n=1 Tax=Hymenobacter sp. CA1UV-4 TaxID=3063782 RepID=UPI002713A4AE|nr:hypothetical protein [Hymenobacter sp. CA1UV-4]MDO7854431.1 hypothetical protein [Hymenobacter sp. CA1UV-4]
MQKASLAGLASATTLAGAATRWGILHPQYPQKYMKTHVAGKAVVAATAPTPQAADQVNGLRNLILDLLFGSPFITTQEWATAVERTSNTENVATLAKWYRNAVRELADREEKAATAYASRQQREEIIRLLNNPLITRRHKTRVLLGINRYQADEARAIIANLTAYIAAPFGGGAVGAFSGTVSYAA